MDIISDTVCPWCYIGKRRFEQAVALRPGNEFQIGWRPFQLNPEMPGAGMPRQEYLKAKFGGVDRADRVYEAVGIAGEEVGLSFNFRRIPRQPNTFDSHRLVRWSESAGVQDAVVEALFQRYFLGEVDLGDQSDLVGIAESCGMDGELVRELFERDADRDLVMAEEGIARRMGINGVPCFVIDHKYAISGAQEPSVLTHVFDLALQGEVPKNRGSANPPEAPREILQQPPQETGDAGAD
ncbi:MAG: DsbA family oxidoreductase [Proteobacteria bacterium]|nr:DsbA family oxidoreductase [Pseudomonadota bacterium]